MSRISPFHFNVHEYADEELENICPRYLKWMKKVKAFDFSKRKKAKIERSVPSFELKYKLGENSRTPKRSRNFLSKIRKGGQNLRVRVRTSADLWRRWIRGGIMYNTELNESDEQELENQESEPQKVESQSNEKESKVSENNKTEVVIKITETETSDKTQTETVETDVKPIETENSEENKTQTTESVVEKSETIVTQNIDNPVINLEETPELKINKNEVRSETNSTLSVNNSINGMPEVVANND